MKRTLFAAVALALLYGCASTPETKPAEPQATPAQPPAAPPAAEVKPLPPAAMQGESLKEGTLGKRSVFYDLDKYDVKDEYRPLVQAHGKYLAEHSNAKMLVQGNCDERGSREYNLALGQRRAEAVKKIMVVLGVPDGRIETTSFGEEKPVAPGHDEASWAKNRRDDIKYAGE
jgi:peptidoglycan-associated lipoprotein